MFSLWATASTSLSTIAISRRSEFSMPVDFGRHIDHTLLSPTGTTSDVSRLCREARDYAMAAVCVFPSHVSLAREVLRNTRVKIATVIAFPFGATYTEVKAAEMRAAASMGEDEADI